MYYKHYSPYFTNEKTETQRVLVSAQYTQVESNNSRIQTICWTTEESMLL